MKQYIATVHKEQTSNYGVQFYDFPGCITAGATIEEAHDMATGALTGHIELMITDGDEIPTPSSLEIILTDPDHQDAIAQRLLSQTTKCLALRDRVFRS